MSTCRHFGETPVDTAIRKLQSEFFGYFDADKISSFRDLFVKATPHLYGSYAIICTLDQETLPENFVEDLESMRTTRSALSDGELLFSETPKFWSGPNGFHVVKETEEDVCAS